MKKKKRRDSLFFIVCIVLVLAGSFFITKPFKGLTQDYSLDNNNKSGLSAFYKTLRLLNYPIEKSEMQIRPIEYPSIQIIPPGGSFSIDDPRIMSWVSRGGVLVCLTLDEPSKQLYNSYPLLKNQMAVYPYRKGHVIEMKVSLLTNEALLSDTSAAYGLLREIDPYNSRHWKIIYNEAYLHISHAAPSLWDAIPLSLKFLLYQLLLVIAAYFYANGKRFGKPQKLVEEVEREENEHLYATAALYSQAGCWDLMMESYYIEFLGNFRSEQTWLSEWEALALPDLPKARRLHILLEKPTNKDYVLAIRLIEELNKSLQKRRDRNWKHLKKI